MSKAHADLYQVHMVRLCMNDDLSPSKVAVSFTKRFDALDRRRAPAGYPGADRRAKCPHRL